MTQYYEFPCGCKFEILNESPLRLKFEPDIEKINHNCPEVWKWLGEKSCKGIFQLDSQLSEHIVHQYKPKSIEELAICITISRPGTLDARTEEGKTVTQSIIDRKNNIEEVKVIDQLKDILSNTYGHMAYQEQIMALSGKLAGFTAGEQNILRKMFAKKKPELLAELKIKFIDGCKKLNIVDQDEALRIFDNISAASRYSFNKSHSVVYAELAFLVATAKVHFPKAFYTSALKHAIDKQKPFEEINDLVNDARNNSIDIYPPDIRKLNKDFALINSEIYFGLGDIRGIGESVIRQLTAVVDETEKKIGDKNNWRWLDILFYVLPYINATASKALICSGAIDFCRVDRIRMYYEYEKYMELKDREQTWIVKEYEKDKNKSLTQLVELLTNVPSGRLAGGCSSGKRLEAVINMLSLLKAPPYKLSDSIEWLAGVEQELMGISLSCTKVDACDISNANCNCREFNNGYNRPGPIIIAIGIDRIKEIITKKGDKMCFISGNDITGSIDNIVVFPQVFTASKGLLIEKNTIMISGKRDEKIKSNFIVYKVFQI